MTPFQLDLAKIASTKLESLRESFETHLIEALRDQPGFGPQQREVILQRAPEGNYTHAEIDGGWHGFQWGADHVRDLVRNILDRLEAPQEHADRDTAGHTPEAPDR